MVDNEKSPQVEIKLVDLYKTYDMGEVKVPVLKGVNLEIYKGQLLAILGESGSGKSTLLNMIGGIDRPNSGRILFGEQDIAQLSDRALTIYRRKNVGFVSSFTTWWPP